MVEIRGTRRSALIPSKTVKREWCKAREQADMKSAILHDTHARLLTDAKREDKETTRLGWRC